MTQKKDYCSCYNLWVAPYYGLTREGKCSECGKEVRND